MVNERLQSTLKLLFGAHCGIADVAISNFADKCQLAIISLTSFVSRSAFAIEIDGPSHSESNQVLRDTVRDDWFQREGFRVLRISNDLVIGSPDIAIRQITDALNH